MDDECKYYTERFEKQNGIWDDVSFCTKNKEYIPDENEICENYLKSEKCFNCKHSREIIYETGTIYCIDYHCRLQNDKMIFSDSSWAASNYADFPDCNINKWESF